MNSEHETSANEHDETVDYEDDAVIGIAFRRSLIVIAVLLVCGAAVLFWMRRPSETVVDQHTPLTQPEFQAAPPLTIPDIPFRNITKSSGVTFVHENGSRGAKLLPETMGGGCAFLDYDADGDQDLLLINSTSWDSTTDQRPTMALYRNDGHAQFEDVTVASGLDVSLYGMGCAVGDYDNDGHVDVFISAVGGNRLFRNNGTKFTDVTQRAGVAGTGQDWSTGCGWIDIDNDGDLDLFVANYLSWSPEEDAAKNFTLDGTRRAFGRPQEFGGTYPYLYRNDGNGTFSDISDSGGVQIKTAELGKPLCKSLGVSFADLNGDSLIDIVVANDTVRNLLFLNQGQATFKEIGTIAGVAFDSEGRARGAMGIDIAKFRNTNATGIAIGNFSNEMTALYVNQDSQTDLPQFSDEAVSNGLGPVTRRELTFGVLFLDTDLDGRLDLFCANGHLEQDIAVVQPVQKYEQSPQLLWNCGPDHPREFIPVPQKQCGEEFVEPLVGRGAAYADLDADGDLDLLITTSGQSPRLLRNDQQSKHHWLRIKLQGTACNRDAIGAWVEVTVADRTQRRQVMPTRSYLSQVELPVTFGLGTQAAKPKVRVIWPDGSEQIVSEVPIDTVLKVVQQRKKP